MLNEEQDKNTKRFVNCPLLVCTVGLPRSGKTTWAREQGYPIVNPDSIRLALHGQRFVVEAEDMVWSIAKIMVRALFRAGHDIVIVDATNTTTKRRDFWKHEDWTTVFKYLHTPESICVERAIKDSDDVIISVIKRMSGQLEPLSETEKEVGEITYCPYGEMKWAAILAM